MRAPAGGAAANSTSATSAGPAVATPRSRQGGPAAVQVTSSRSVSPGSTGRRKRALSTASTRSTRRYGNARPPRAPRSGWFVMGPLLLARAALRPLLVGRGVVQLHDLVGHVDRLVIVEERAAGGLEHERVAVLLAVVAHQLVELRDDALGELGVGLLEIALEVLVLALELEAAALEVLLQVAPLLVLEHRRLALVVLLQPVQVLALLLQLVLRALELRLHLVLGLLAGVALVERALHVDHGDLLLQRRERSRPERDHDRDQPERHAGHPAALDSSHPISHVSASPSSLQYWNGAPNENSTRLFWSWGLLRNAFPSSMRSGPMGDSHRTPAPPERRVSSHVKPWSAL